MTKPAPLWFYRSSDESEVGPLSSSELKKRALRGEVKADTLVRRGQSGNWAPASKVNGLSFGDVAPPPVVTVVMEPPSPISPPSNPNLHPCPDCGTQVSRRASACPACGSPLAQSREKAHANGAEPTIGTTVKTTGKMVWNFPVALLLTPVVMAIIWFVTVVVLETIQGIVENGFGRGYAAETWPITRPLATLLALSFGGYILYCMFGPTKKR